MQQNLALIRKAASSDVGVFLSGESGTGKELAAHSIHDLSLRHDKPFVAVNCGALPENLIESILFGHEKGAFTGAADRHAGVFEEAHGGTLFLDEIGEMPLDLQTRLLRVLETKTLRRVGGKQDINVDIRLIAATNKDLKQEVAKENFRQDLFFRLYIFPIILPPLRERLEDLEILVGHFLRMFAPHGKKFSASPDAIEKLKNHAWPGNVRELKNTIQRAVVMASAETLEAKDIPLTLVEASFEPGKLELGEQEKLSILDALRKSGGNRAEASRHLGIARTTLASKLRRYGINAKII